MIYFNIALSNPFNRKSDYHIFLKNGRITKNKSWELEINRHPKTLFSIGIDLSLKRSHSGICIWGGLFGYWMNFEIYDNRHWSYANNCWENEE